MAAPPIIATCNAMGPDSPVDVPAAHPLVLSTAYLGWDAGPAGAGGVAQSRLPTWKMLVVFGRRCSGSQAPADLPASRMASPLRLAFVGAFWSRVLNELLTSGILNVAATSRTELIVGIGWLGGFP